MIRANGELGQVQERVVISVRALEVLLGVSAHFGNLAIFRGVELAVVVDVKPSETGFSAERRWARVTGRNTQDALQATCLKS